MIAKMYFVAFVALSTLAAVQIGERDALCAAVLGGAAGFCVARVWPEFLPAAGLAAALLVPGCALLEPSSLIDAGARADQVRHGRTGRFRYEARPDGTRILEDDRTDDFGADAGSAELRGFRLPLRRATP